MKTDYKFWYIRKDDDGLITEVAIRFFEGDITTELELNSDLLSVPITRYRRIRQLTKQDLSYITNPIKKDSNGKDCVIYTSEDFGKTILEKDIKDFLDKELLKDKSRTALVIN